MAAFDVRVLEGEQPSRKAVVLCLSSWFQSTSHKEINLSAQLMTAREVDEKIDQLKMQIEALRQPAKKKLTTS